MKTFEKIYAVTATIPKGKVFTYQQLAKIAGIKNPKIVGFALHVNKNPKKVPCHRVIKSNGTLAKGYALGGRLKQKEKLEKEGIVFSKGKADLEKFFYKPTKLLLLYFQLLFKLNSPGEWPWYEDSPHSKEEIIIGSVLTQNTNWKNVQKAIENLRKEKVNNILGIYKLGLKNYELLKILVKPSGFYNQKAQTLFSLCQFIANNHQNLEKLSKLETTNIREDLLKIKGIGKETADTILLYALGKPIFVIDNYTKKITQRFNLINSSNYDLLQKYFMKNLPKDVLLYKNYHALIIKSGKTED